jgi:hypothetical protein
VEDNGSGGIGGGMYNDGTVTLYESTFGGPTANLGNIAYGDGGGIYNDGNLTVNASNIQANHAPDGNGGGIYNNAGAILLVENNSGFWFNTAETGAGIDNVSYGSSSLPGVLVVNSTFNDNSATWNGGGIANLGSAFIVASIFDYDHAGNDGGGIYNSSSLSLASSYNGNTYGPSVFGWDSASTNGGGIFNIGGLSGINNLSFQSGNWAPNGPNIGDFPYYVY